MGSSPGVRTYALRDVRALSILLPHGLLEGSFCGVVMRR